MPHHRKILGDSNNEHIDGKGRQMRIYKAIAITTILVLSGVSTISAQAAINPCVSGCNMTLDPNSPEARAYKKSMEKARAKSKALGRIKAREFNRRFEGLKKAKEFNQGRRPKLKLRGNRRNFRRTRIRRMRRFNVRRPNFGRMRRFRMNRFRGAPRFRMRGFGRRR
jgi:hypothetical protein